MRISWKGFFTSSMEKIHESIEILNFDYSEFFWGYPFIPHKDGPRYVFSQRGSMYRYSTTRWTRRERFVRWFINHHIGWLKKLEERGKQNDKS